MGIFEFLIVAAIIGLVAWALTQLIPMPPTIARVIIAAAGLLILLLLLRATIGDVAMPRLR